MSGMHQVCADTDPSKPLSDALLSKTFERAAQTFPWIANYKDRSITELEVPLLALSISEQRTKV
jgi:hypothetical protein